MKKLYFTLLSFFAGLTLVNAQLLTQANHAPVVGDTYQMIQIDSTGINPGLASPSAVWTFTTPNTRTLTIVNTYTTPASISSGSLYPSATVVQSNPNLKNFYSSTAAELNFWGGSFTALSQTVDYYFSTPAIHMKYAMAYNTSTTAAFTGSLQSGTNAGGITAGTSTVIADGTGTLNLPGRSFTNVLRINTYTGFAFNVPAFGANGTVKQQTWDYYSTLSNYPSTKLYPLFSIVANTISVTSPLPSTQATTLVLINKDYQYVGITENSSEVAELNMFPNPAGNNFNLVFVNENANDVTVEISNAIGQVVQKENYAGTKGVSAQNVDVAKLQSGVYFVKVNVGNKSSVKKLTIQ